MFCHFFPLKKAISIPQKAPVRAHVTPQTNFCLPKPTTYVASKRTVFDVDINSVQFSYDFSDLMHNTDFVSVNIYIYIYIYVCVCNYNIHIIYIYIYIYTIKREIILKCEQYFY